MLKFELSSFVPYLCYFQLVYLQGQTNVVDIINIMLNNPPQIKNLQPGTDLVVNSLTNNHQDYRLWLQTS